MTDKLNEQQMVEWLKQHPDFFERHADSFAETHLSSSHGGRAISLQQRQVEILRDKVHQLELRLATLVAHGHDNTHIARQLHQWSQHLLSCRHPEDLPERILNQMREVFQLQQVALKIWGVAPIYAREAFAQGASDNAKTLATSLIEPYCGPHTGFEVVDWVTDSSSVQSVALIPLRALHAAPGDAAIGLLVLASADAERFQIDMGTEFLQHLGELSSAALSRLGEHV